MNRDDFPLDSIWVNLGEPEDRIRIIGYLDTSVVVWDTDNEAVSFIESERLNDAYQMVLPDPFDGIKVGQVWDGKDGEPPVEVVALIPAVWGVPDRVVVDEQGDPQVSAFLVPAFRGTYALSQEEQ